MHAKNPYELFRPIHLAWLYRRRAMKLDVTAADLDSIERHQPEAVYERRSSPAWTTQLPSPTMGK